MRTASGGAPDGIERVMPAADPCDELLSWCGGTQPDIVYVKGCRVAALRIRQQSRPHWRLP